MLLNITKCMKLNSSLLRDTVQSFIFKFDFINPYPAKYIYLNFQPLEVVFRYRDPQPQVVENYSHFF